VLTLPGILVWKPERFIQSAARGGNFITAKNSHWAFGSWIFLVLYFHISILLFMILGVTPQKTLKPNLDRPTAL